MYFLKEQILYKSTFIAVPSVLLYRDSTVFMLLQLNLDKSDLCGPF